MDGARIANAIVSLRKTPAEVTWKAGVDILSLGATKNGVFAAEAVIFLILQRPLILNFEEKGAGIFFQNIDFYQLSFYLTWKQIGG